MRIAVWHGLQFGGARSAMDQLTASLAERHEVETFVVTASPKQHPGCRSVLWSPRQHVRGGSYWNDWLTLLDMRDLQRLEGRAARSLDAAGYNVILTSTLHSGQAPGVLAHLTTPSAYYCHEPPRRFLEPWCRPDVSPMSSRERARYFYRRPVQRLVDEVVRRRDIRHVGYAGAVLVNSRYTQGLVRAVYSRASDVCYLGVDSTIFSPPAKPCGRAGVLSVGALERHKAFDFLIRALARLPGERPRLTIVGGGGHRRAAERLQRLARRLEVPLTIRSNVSREELVALYQSHAVFLFSARMEPFGLVLLEAMACGLPVVAVGEGGVPESVRPCETGLLAPRDEAAFAAAVAALLGDSHRLRRMSEAARAHAANWTWQAAGRRVEDCLEHLISIEQKSNLPSREILQR